MMTCAWLVQDDYQGLAGALSELLRVAEQLGNRFFLGWYHICVGWAASHQGDLGLARSALETALAYDQELGGAATGGAALAILGEVEALTGHYETAEKCLGTVLARTATPGDPDRGLYPDSCGAPFAVPALGRLAVGRGAPDDARRLVEPFVDSLRSVGGPLWLSWGLSVLGLAHLVEGDDAAAQTVLDEAKGIAVLLGNPWLTAQADHHLAGVARYRGEAGRAEDLFHEALARRARHGLRSGVAESLEALAALSAGHESYGEAARLFGAAAAMRRSMGLARWPAEGDAYEADVAGVHAALGDTAFASAWAEGEALDDTAAVAYASRSRGERKRPSAGWLSLTPTEVEVVKLAARGLTNPEIGERLFITRGTVKTHLARVFTKLSVATRSELAAEAARRGF
jgi:DNA-binding CsgD family transcriptional regulator/tetratricopeptide (TPR) repeat protein